VTSPDTGAVREAPRWSAVQALRRRLVPPPPPAAITRLRWLILVTALAVVAVEWLNLLVADDLAYPMVVRTTWAAARAAGFLVLMRMVRFGRAAARPFALILAVTTVFAVARLTEPRHGAYLPRAEVVAGLLVLAGLCAAVVGVLYRSSAVAAHLAHQPARRHLPPSVLTARVAILSYGALVLVPLLVAAGTLVDGCLQGCGPTRVVPTVAVLVAWAALFVGLSVLLPFGAFFLLFGKRWARWLVGALSVVVLVAQPLFCYLLLGWDGLLRDGVPLIITALVGLVALVRSRGLPAGQRLG